MQARSREALAEQYSLRECPQAPTPGASVRPPGVSDRGQVVRIGSGSADELRPAQGCDRHNSDVAMTKCPKTLG